MTTYIRLLPALSPVNRLSQSRYRTLSAALLRRSGIIIEGLPLWISPRTYFDLSAPACIVLGDRCVVSHYVRLLTHDFSLDRIAERMFGESDREVSLSRPVRVGAQAFVGMGALVMPGVQIGDGAIVGAGSVATKDVPKDEVWAGNPARLVSTTKELWNRRADDVAWHQRRA